MRKRLAIALAAFVLWTLWSISARHCAAQIEPAADAPQPHSPEESLSLFQIADGFRLELAAGEPNLADPVAMAFDARGRIFVCEIHGYNLEGHLDVTELNKTGVLDKSVRRIAANPDAIKQAEKDQYGTVKLLEDSDGDGRFERHSVWADRLPPCYGVVPARDGVVVLCAPDIIFLADRDGDGKAEVRDTLFSGFNAGELWTRINNPRWGPDNWIYGVSGAGSSGTIRGPALAKEVPIGAVCFRFKPDGSRFEPCSGRTSGFGQAINDWGDRFLCTNQQHALQVAPLPYRYLARNPYYAASNTMVNVSSYGHPAEVYPVSQPHPWRLARSKQPEWVKFYGAAEATANGYFTAASGQTIYRGTLFPVEYHGNHFSVDNAQNLIHRCFLQRDGTAYAARRATQEKTEFLSSTEHWFRPVNLTTGPDGALYVVDMYREIIEDYSAIPRYLQQQYGLIRGEDRGRIWRVVPEAASKSRNFDLTRASDDELVDELRNDNAWWRNTAQRLLVERGATVTPNLAALVENGPTPQSRLHALYTLDGLGKLEPKEVARALADSHWAVRMHALQLAERWLDEHSELTEQVLEMGDDPEPRVRLQLGFTLGQTKDPRAVDALAELAANYASDRWMQAAILSSLVGSADQLLEKLLTRAGGPGHGDQLLRAIASTVGARRQDDQIGNLLNTVARATGASHKRLRVDCLEGLIDGLQRGKPEQLASKAGQAGLRLLLASPSIEVRKLAFQVAGLVRLQDTPEMNASYAHAVKLALDDALSVPDRQLAISLLSGATYSTLAPMVQKLLDPRQPLDLQLAAVTVLSSTDDSRAGSLLLAGFESFSPNVQTAVIDAIFSRQNRLPALLDAIDQQTVHPASLEAIRRTQLMENPDPQTRNRAKTLLADRRAGQDRQEVLNRYVAALSMSRDTTRGKLAYEAQCAKCHKLKGEGFEVGPDLATVNNRADEILLSDVMDPSSQITVGYRNYTVITEAGRIFTGVLSAETATSITLRKEQAEDQIILRKDVDEMEASAISMMPEDLEKEVSVQDVADLIAYLRDALGPVSPQSVTLFDDDPQFVELLSQGAGKASIRSDDPFSGTASLAITPPQRWSERLPGWDYPIKENPGPEEFRYIRFAWKSHGTGVMIELADDGRWPVAENPIRRYYSGSNTTGWSAVEVTENPPSDWVVVTRDLWRDFGDFNLTGIAPTAMGGEAFFDRIELLRSLDVAPLQ